MLLFCKKCGVVVYKDDGLELKRHKDGDSKLHCNICGNDRFDIVGL